MAHPPEVHEFWDLVKRRTGIEGDFQDAWGFGDSPELVDHLLALVLEGKKRASCNLLRETELEGWPGTVVGAYNIILNGAGHPRAVIRTVNVQRCAFRDVTAEHAYLEGEDDRTLTSFRREHIKYLTRVGQRLGFEFHEDMEVEMESFELVYPL
ncbi:MAG: ASCH domain-containing protein [Thermoplasmata archaeon]|nr:ASCH domain-containing protein [Thermoplasmata archaeon]